MVFDAAAFLEELFRSDSAASADPATAACCPAVETTDIRPDDLPEYWRELYEERAAIRQYDGGQPREHAEAEALREIIVWMRSSNAT